MTIYFDTSALLKLYVTEEYSDITRELLNKSRQVSTSLVSYAEARSAFARRRREKSLAGLNEKELVDLLDLEWPRYYLIGVSKPLVISAADLASIHGLKAYDALHLASALELQRNLKRSVTFVAFDQSLNRAAKKVGLKLVKTVADYSSPDRPKRPKNR